MTARSLSLADKQTGVTDHNCKVSRRNQAKRRVNLLGNDMISKYESPCSV